MSATNPAVLIAQISARYEALVLRERLLVACASIAVIWVLWDFLAYTPMSKQLSQVNSAVDGAQIQLNAAAQEQRLLSAADTQDPNLLLQDQRLKLQAELETLETELREAIAQFVEPQKMPQLLAELMAQHRGLRFKRVTRLPSEPIAASLSGDMVQEASTSADTTGNKEMGSLSGSGEGHSSADVASLYRHPIELEFQGNYFDVLSYLASLEQSSWRLNWRNLKYQVDDYPNATVTVQVDTLSRNREWLGV